MPVPTYHARGGWLRGDWQEIGAKYSWAQVCGNFRWDELQAGPIPDADIEELQIARRVSTMFDRLKTGEARVQMDNSRGQYTGTKSAQNRMHYSDNFASGANWVSSAQGAQVSLSVLVDRMGAIAAAAVAEYNGAGFHSLQTTGSLVVVSGANAILGVDIYAGTRDRLVWQLTDPSETDGFSAQFSVRSMTASVVSAMGAGTAGVASMQTLSNGWVRCTVSGRVPNSLGMAKLYLVNSAGVSSYTGTGSAWAGVRAVQLHHGDLGTDFVPTFGNPLYARDTFISPNDVFTLKALDGSSVYNLFSGYVEQWGFNPALRDSRKIQFGAYDIADRLRPIVTTSVMQNMTHRNILQAVMSHTNINPLQYTIDQMNDLVAVSYLDQMSAGECLAQLQQNGAQLYYVDGAGRLVMRSRFWDVQSTPAVASVAVAFAMTVQLSTDSILNRIELTTTPRKIQPDVSTIAWITEAVFVPAGTTRSFVLDYVDAVTNETGVPCIDVEAQRRGVDYLFNVSPKGDSGDLTSAVMLVSSVSATAAYFTVSNPGGANGYLSTCQLMGKTARRQPQLSRIMVDSASVAKYQARYTAIGADLAGTDNRLRDLGEYLLDDRANPKHQLTFALKNEWPANIAVDLLSRMHVANSLANIASVWGVFEIEHTIQFNAGVEHVTKYGTQLMPVKNWFTLDSPTLGRLDYNRLGS